MNTRFLKCLLTVTVFFSMMFVAANVAAKKPVKPPPDPVVEANHALAVAGLSNSDIRVMDVDGSNSELIARKVSISPSIPMVWSPDGTRIIWTDGYNRNLQMVNADGSNRQEILAATGEMMPNILGMHNLASSGVDCGGYQANLLYFLGLVTDDPWSWVPEDSWEEFYFLDLDNLSAPPVRLTTNELERHTNLDVSPDGQFIATWTYDSSKGISEGRLEIREVCKPDLPVLSSWTVQDLGGSSGTQFYKRIDWSSKNLLAANGYDEDHDSHIYLIDILSEPITVLKIIGTGTDFGAGVNNGYASWSPDGSQLAFRSDKEVYTLDIDTGAFTLVVASKSIRGVDWRPTWVEKP